MIGDYIEFYNNYKDVICRYCNILCIEAEVDTGEYKGVHANFFRWFHKDNFVSEVMYAKDNIVSYDVSNWFHYVKKGEKASAEYLFRELDKEKFNAWVILAVINTLLNSDFRRHSIVDKELYKMQEAVESYCYKNRMYTFENKWKGCIPGITFRENCFKSLNVFVESDYYTDIQRDILNLDVFVGVVNAVKEFLCKEYVICHFYTKDDYKVEKFR